MNSLRSRPIPVLVACSFLALAAPAGAQPEQPRQSPPATPQTPSAAFEQQLLAVMARPGGLTSVEVGRRAAETSYDVKARMAELLANMATVDQTIAQFLPRLSLTGRYVRLSPIDPPTLLPADQMQQMGGLVGSPISPGPNGEPVLIPAGTPLVAINPFANFTFPVLLNQTTFMLSLNVPLSDYVLRLSGAIAGARKSERMAKINVEAAKLKAATDARALYYQWVRVRLSVVVAEQAVVQARGHLRDAEQAFSAGTVSKADVMRVEAQVATAELLVSRTQHLAQLLEEQLHVAMHDEPGPLAIGEDFSSDPRGEPAGDSSQPFVEEALGKRLEIRALDEAVGALQDQARVTRAGYYPRLDAFGNVTYANPNPRIFPQQEKFTATWDVGAQLLWSPNDLMITRAQVRGVEAKAAQTDAQRQQLRDGVRAEVLAAYQALRDAESSLVSSRRALAASEESYRVRRDLFAFGRATSIELTDAEAELTRARLEAINARVDLRLARVRLDHAVGRDIPAK